MLQRASSEIFWLLQLLVELHQGNGVCDGVLCSCGALSFYKAAEHPVSRFPVSENHLGFAGVSCIWVPSSVEPPPLISPVTLAETGLS